MTDISAKLSTRQFQILERVQAEGYGAIDAFAAEFAVSTQTIRRDVNALCETGELRRVRGGVEPMPASQNQLYASRQILNAGAKRLIAEGVRPQIADGATLAISIGTTPAIVARSLGDLEDLTILTNNLNIAMWACERPGWSVRVPGGPLRAGDRDILGPEALSFFNRYQVDVGLFGVGGVASDGTLLDFTEDEVGARMAILRNSRRSFLVLDHSKFGRVAHVRGGHIGDVSDIFCDRALPVEIAQIVAPGESRFTLCAQADQ
ncbi:DeoR/GlpR family DNA-binding transcription regulator [Thalassovita taeanensis]|uniref:Transcriptional regulator, DeoR family n=1 Tax=Thalassovita taeanensis TaxID=657014 RepID=A0A1H9J7R0_9RHOB|nr:DeoR/GlpR family DNA-binding transcription regulator [Thalassovita taeanensis]SEQ82924.1 transcriptional regulator, DeoR family [Thalassovita taeanensis]